MAQTEPSARLAAIARRHCARGKQGSSATGSSGKQNADSLVYTANAAQTAIGTHHTRRAVRQYAKTANTAVRAKNVARRSKRASAKATVSARDPCSANSSAAANAAARRIPSRVTSTYTRQVLAACATRLQIGRAHV